MVHSLVYIQLPCPQRAEHSLHSSHCRSHNYYMQLLFVTKTDYENNNCHCFLFKPMGILSLVDEDCWFPKATDKTLVEKLLNTHTSHPKFQRPDFRDRASFSVIHYAGRVDYCCEQWLLKNMDPLNENIVGLFQESANEFMRNIWKDG